MSANPPPTTSPPSRASPGRARTPWCTTISSQGSAAYPMQGELERPVKTVV